uniref:Uncharacterized protein n=1 Tax=Solanum tuberosum TaxID=4113 RepID=M1DSY1_SOLTU
MLNKDDAVQTDNANSEGETEEDDQSQCERSKGYLNSVFEGSTEITIRGTRLRKTGSLKTYHEARAAKNIELPERLLRNHAEANALLILHCQSLVLNPLTPPKFPCS